jgi:hypothetical protein
MTGQDFPEMGHILNLPPERGRIDHEYEGILDSGTRREFETGAVRDMSEGKGRFDILPYYGIEAVARLMEQGAKKYGERNCFKGIPNHSFLDSGMRHASKFLRGMADEPHLVMAAWNLLMAVDQQERVKRGLLPPELDDCGVTVDVECGDLIDAPGPHFIETDNMLARDRIAHELCPQYMKHSCVGEAICEDCDLQGTGV